MSIFSNWQDVEHDQTIKRLCLFQSLNQALDIHRGDVFETSWQTCTSKTKFKPCSLPEHIIFKSNHDCFSLIVNVILSM